MSSSSPLPPSDFHRSAVSAAIAAFPVHWQRTESAVAVPWRTMWVPPGPRLGFPSSRSSSTVLAVGLWAGPAPLTPELASFISLTSLGLVSGSGVSCPGLASVGAVAAEGVTGVGTGVGTGVIGGPSVGLGASAGVGSEVAVGREVGTAVALPSSIAGSAGPPSGCPGVGVSAVVILVGSSSPCGGAVSGVCPFVVGEGVVPQAPAAMSPMTSRMISRGVAFVLGFGVLNDSPSPGWILPVHCHPDWETRLCCCR